MDHTLLAPLTDRALTLVATALAGTKVTVLRSSRLNAPAALVLDPLTLLLDPEQVGPYDLLLLARLAARLTARPPRRDQLPARVVSRLLRREQASLARNFPGAAAWPGCLRPRRRGSPQRVLLPEIARTRVNLAPLRLSDLGAGGLEALHATGIDFTGTDEQHATLVAAIEQGRLPLQEHPSVPGLPYAVIPVRLETLARPAARKGDDAPPKEDEIEKFAWDVARCMQENLAGLEDEQRRPAQTSGREIDPARLYEAALAMRLGGMPRVFRPSRQSPASSFRPERHLAVLGFDVHSMQRALDRRGRLRTNMMAGLARTYKVLEIPCAVLAFRDRIVGLSDGRRVYLHMPCVLKAIDEPFSPAVLARMEACWGDARELGQAACHVPLQLEALERQAAVATATEQPLWFRIDYYAIDALPTPFDDEGTLTRLADGAERVLDRLKTISTAETDVCLFLPPRLTRAAAPGTEVRKASDLGL